MGESFFTVAVMVQISSSLYVFPKAGIPVILIPFLTIQKMEAGDSSGGFNQVGSSGIQAAGDCAGSAVADAQIEW